MGDRFRAEVSNLLYLVAWKGRQAPLRARAQMGCACAKMSLVDVRTNGLRVSTCAHTNSRM